MSHPSIVRLLDLFAEGSQLIIVWELIKGCDLLDQLNKYAGERCALCRVTCWQPS